MPTREDINKFKQYVNLWGDEPAVMAALGEPIEDVPPPEPSVEDSLNLDALEGDDLSLEDFLNQAGEDESSEQAGPTAEDFLQELNQLGSDGLSKPEGLGEEGFPDLDGLNFGETFPEPETPPDQEGSFKPESLPDLEGFSELDSLTAEGGMPSLDELTGKEGFSEPEEQTEPTEFSGLDSLTAEGGMPSLDELTGKSGLDSLTAQEDLPFLDELTGKEGAPEPEEQIEPKGFSGLDSLTAEEGSSPLDELFEKDESSPQNELSIDKLYGFEEQTDGMPPLEDLPSEDPASSEEGSLTNIDIEDFNDIEDFDSPEGSFPSRGSGDSTLESLDIPSLEEEGDTQFDLGDMGKSFDFQDEGFNFDEEGSGSLESLDSLDNFLVDDLDEGETEEDPFQISEDHVKAIQKKLDSFPLNLKIAIEETLAEAEDLKGVRYSKLIQMLSSGSTTRQIVTEYFNITGKKIQLPRGYDKQSGRNFELRQSGFLYQFIKRGWPLIKIGTTALIILGIMIYIGFSFVYRPLQATVYYRQGLKRIAEDQFAEGDALFHKAYFGWRAGPLEIEGWPSKKRFLQYGEAFKARRNYPAAGRMYEALVGEFPGYMTGYLEYGLFLTHITGDYPYAAEILSLGLDRDMYNYKLMLALGDTYFIWSEEEPDKLEDARYIYAATLSRNDKKDEVLLRMLSYFLRVKDEKNINILYNIYVKKSSIKGDSAYTARILSELGGYYIDRNEVSKAKDLLFKAEQINTTIPEVHYQLSRYFQKTFNPGQEKKALQKALFFMDQIHPLNRSRIYEKINIYRRRGEMNYKEGLSEKAEIDLEAGIHLVEGSQARGLIGSSRDIGALYKDMGNIHYEIHDDLKGALGYYDKAEENGYQSIDLSYRRGYILYEQKDYNLAVLAFERALKQRPENTRNIRFALGNTMIHRQNFSGARDNYLALLRDLKNEEDSLPYLAPEDIMEHRSLVNYFIRTYNNLAYTEYALSQRARDPDRESHALLYFTKAADYADRLDRNPETRVRSHPEDSLVFQNTMSIVKPVPGRKVQLYDELTRDADVLLTR